MTALMCQVTYNLCNLKIDETEWKYHVSSTNHLKNFKNVDEKIAIKFFEMISDVRPEKQKRREFLIQKMKKHTISGSFIFQQNYQRRSLIQYVIIQSIN